MTKFSLVSRSVALLLAAACTTTPPPLPVRSDGGIATLAVDPRLGYPERAGDQAARTSLEAALRSLQTGDAARAGRELAELRRRAPGYRPATLTEGAIALERGDLELAAQRIEAAASGVDGWTASEFYRGELALARGDDREALTRFRSISASPGAPAAVGDRIASIETRLFDQLYHSASTIPGPAAIASLREALSLRPDSSSARLLLVQKLIEGGNLAEARMEIDPLLRGRESEQPEVQQALAEIEAGRGNFEDAITRYERILRNDPRPDYAARLEAIKREFAMANMPPRYRDAVESPLLTRSQLAVLAYWTVSALRFGRPAGEPPVAIDIAEVPGRDELVRAIAFGLIAPDPVTRRVDPERVVSAIGAARILHRLLIMRGVPDCAAGQTDPLLALEACGADLAPVRRDSGGSVSGEWARRALERIDAVLSAE